LEHAAHREFVVFFHDEPEFVPPHAHMEPHPCPEPDHGHGGAHGGPNDTLNITPESEELPWPVWSALAQIAYGTAGLCREDTTGRSAGAVSN